MYQHPSDPPLSSLHSFQSAFQRVSLLPVAVPTRKRKYSVLGEDDSDDHAVETESLTEDKHKNHADEDSLLLSVGADTCITDNTNCESSGLTNN